MNNEILNSELGSIINTVVKTRNNLISILKNTYIDIPNEQKKNELFAANSSAELIRNQCLEACLYVAHENKISNDFRYFAVRSQEAVCPTIGHYMLGIEDTKNHQFVAIDLTASQTYTYSESPIEHVPIFGPFNNEAELLQRIGKVYSQQQFDKTSRKYIMLPHSTWFTDDFNFSEADETLDVMVGRLKHNAQTAYSKK